MLSTLPDRSGAWYHRIALLWSRGVLAIAGVRLVVEGAARIPTDRSVIFMGNHQGNFDIPALFQAVPIRFNWLAKEELFRIPVFGASMRSAGYVPVNRGDGRESLKSIDHAASLVRNGVSIAVFPEGTRSADGKLLPFKRGGFMLAARAGVPIVPFTITGSREVNPPGGLLRLRPGVIRISFSQPVPVNGRSAADQSLLMENVRRAIAAGLEN